jgi:ABC-type antimicrobial peptide transport system permease subunit
VILARTGGDAATLASTIRRELREMDPDILISGGSQTLQDDVVVALAPSSLAAMGMAFFGVVAVVLTSVGLYGAIAYLVAQRKHEIGVRLAIGAKPREVVWLVVRRGLAVVTAGIVIGTPLAFGAAQVMSALLYGIRSWDLFAWGGAIVVLLVSAVAANTLPARGAARLDPSIALRAE